MTKHRTTFEYNENEILIEYRISQDGKNIKVEILNSPLFDTIDQIIRFKYNEYYKKHMYTIADNLTITNNIPQQNHSFIEAMYNKIRKTEKYCGNPIFNDSKLQ